MASMQELIIEQGRADRQYWRDLLVFRELFYILAWRDILVRYKQTVIGIVWAILKPFLTMLVFTVIFGRLAKMPADGVAPYAIMVYAAMLPWQFFSTALTEASNSLIGNANLISKIYFPRMIIPASSVITSFVDLIIAGVLMLGLMAWYNFWPDWRILLLPVFMMLAFGAAAGPGLLLAALNVKYRDFRHIVPFIVQFGLYLSPVGFSSRIVPQKWQLLYSLNPMVGIIDGFRWCLLKGNPPIFGMGLINCIISTLLMLVFGIMYFRKVERKFSDII